MTSEAVTAPGRPYRDFRTLDFRRLWAGRSKVTRVEARVLADALSGCDPSRVLEIGVGSGRLSGTISQFARQYVATDFTVSFLTRLPAPLRARMSLCVAADAGRLPFADRTFSTVVMIRVYNFLRKPGAALREIRRVLRPGGALVFTHNPRPSSATLVDDLKTHLRPDLFGSAAGFSTFSSRDRTPVRPSAFPAWSYRRRSVARCLREAGLRPIRELATGFEDYRWLRGLPDRLFVASASLAGRIDLLPTRFAVAERVV